MIEGSGSIVLVRRRTLTGHDPTYLDAADFAAKQTFEPQLASLPEGSSRHAARTLTNAAAEAHWITSTDGTSPSLASADHHRYGHGLAR